MHIGISNVARWTTAAGLLAATAGLVLLFMNAAAEVSTGQSQSLMDGYWMGRLPWTAIGIDLAVIGSTIAIVAGTIATWLAGGIIRRIASAVVLAMAAFWWFVAFLTPQGGAYCADCEPSLPDPMTVAYSLPAGAILLLLLPAVVIGVLVFTSPRGRAQADASAG